MAESTAGLQSQAEKLKYKTRLKRSVHFSSDPSFLYIHWVIKEQPIYFLLQMYQQNQNPFSPQFLFHEK
jgi:hypothetical protein